MTPSELQEKYLASKLLPAKAALCNIVAAKILGNRDRYEAVSTANKIPWWVVGIIHSLESGCDFSTHLHNGDPLTARTTHVPKGRPATGTPPFTWEYSAADALKADRIDPTTIGTILDSLEKYNGLGYRNGGGQGTTPPRTSPYLWSMTDQYVKGKYVKDGIFDPEAVSQQVGAAAIMKSLEAKGVTLMSSQNNPAKHTATDVGWFELHVLRNDRGVFDLGLAAKIGGSDETFATARFTCDESLQMAFRNNFPNANSVVLAASGKPWPGDDPATPPPSTSCPTWKGGMRFQRGEDIQLTKNFHLSEFECRCGCPFTVLDGEHVQAMQKFRDHLGRPVHINSGYRCPSHNKAVGGAASSQHLQGNACDVTVDGISPRNVFLQSEDFFNGRGEYASFTHVDSRATKATWKG